MSDSPGNRERGLARLVGLVLVLGTFAAYWPTRHFDYVSYDDWIYVSESPIVQRGLTWEGVQFAFTSTDGGNWHPLVWLSHMLDCGVFGRAAGGHHLTNVLLHAANAVLLFAVLRAMTGALWRSALAAALFAWHPLHVESVAWISERKDTLSTLFWLLTMWAYVRYAREPDARGPKFSANYRLALLFFILGLMCKAMLITLPVVLLLMDWWPLGRISPFRFPIDGSRAGTTGFVRLLLEKVPFIILSLAGCAVAVFAQGQSKTFGDQGLFLRLENAAVSCVTYLVQFFWPAKLSFFYPFPEHIASWRAVGAVLILALISRVVIQFGRQRPYLPAGWFWFLITLAPVIGVVQVGLQAHADRYTYIPYIGLGLGLSWALADLVRARPALKTLTIGASAAGLAGCLIATCVQTRTWRNSFTLYEHALALNPANYFAHNNYGVLLRDKGRYAEAIAHFKSALASKPNYSHAWYNIGVVLERVQNYVAAATNYQNAIKIDSGYVPALVNMGNCYLLLNRPKDAVTPVQAALRIDSKSIEAHDCLGCVLLALGRPEEAAEQLQQALRLDPDNGRAYADLGKVRVAQGRASDAAEAYASAVRFNPKSAESHWNLGKLWLEQGRTNAGLAEMQKAIDLQPGFIDLRRQMGDALMKLGNAPAAQAYYETVAHAEPTNAPIRLALGKAEMAQKSYQAALTNFQEAVRLAPDSPESLDTLARLYAMCPLAAVRNGAEAVRLAERACELTDRRNPRMLDTLGAAYAEAGRFADALKVAGETEQRATTLYDRKLAKAARQRAELYQAGKAYHEEP